MNPTESTGTLAQEVETEYLISTTKFIVLSVLTMGIYAIWWTYKAWRFFQHQENSNMLPAVRAIFSVIFLIPLFNKILNLAKRIGYSKSYSSIWLFFGYVVTCLLAYLPDSLWMLSFAYCVFFIPAFKALNFAKRNDENIIVIEQTKFKPRQKVLLIMGAIWWLLMIIGLWVILSEQYHSSNY